MNISNCQEGHTSGDPINNTTGNLSQVETDYVGAGAFPLVLHRFYNSKSTSAVIFGTFGRNWSHSYSARIAQVSSTEGQVIRADHKALPFSLEQGRWLPTTADVNARLEELTDASGGRTGWRYTTGEDEVETYDAMGRLRTITTRAKLTQSLVYDPQGRLMSVTDPFGRTLMFAYDTRNRVESVTDPAGGKYRYTYDANDNLKTVTGPDDTTRTYHYERADFPHVLTRLDDENDDQFATWSYYSEPPPVRGLVKTSEHAGGADKVEVSYDFANNRTAVTDALGTTRSYTYEQLFDVARTSRAEKPRSSGGGTVSSAWTYDANGNIETYTDYRGHKTALTYDLARNLERTRTEGVGTPLQRTITTHWHPTFRLPTRIEEPERVTTYLYHGDKDTAGQVIDCGATGAVCRLTIQATQDTTVAPRIWNFTYNREGQITQIDGPRTDLSDITTFDYDAQGNLMSRTDALRHTTKITEYDSHGRPKTIVDPNGVITTLGYDLRGRLEFHQVGGERTSYDYDDVGQLEKLTRPDGSFFRFTYDAAHRLTDIIDHLGNTISYTLDAVGNPIGEQVSDSQGNLTQIHSRAPDALNRLERSMIASGHATVYTYDDHDNLTGMTTPLQDSAAWTYDALDRLETSTDLRGALTRYGYDANNQLDTVTDALKHPTEYDYDGVGNLTMVHSPDTGLTEYPLYDDAGNLKTRTDARGQETTYHYDALNRVTLIEYFDFAVGFKYDQGPNGIGRLTEMADPAAITSWTYDAHGRVLQKTQQVDDPQQADDPILLTQYHYDASGRLDAITYPSGQRITFGYTNGQVTQISVDGAVLLRDIKYQPFGPARAWVWGNDTPYSRVFTLNGQVWIYDLGGGRTRELTYDVAGRITEYTDTDPRQTVEQAFMYYASGALREFTRGGTAPTTYTLDANGNRESLTGPQGTDTYTYDPASNQLLRITGAHPKTYGYDDAGNVESDGTNQFVYDGRGRLIQVTNAQGTTEYRINGLEQRVAKVGAQTVSHFVYDEVGRLLGEYTPEGQPIQETIYLDDMPVAVLKDGMTFFVYPDHLGTPRAIVDVKGTVVWRWDSDPFGATQPNEDPDGDRKTFTYNLRFPGQYFDRETGLMYNYFRDYDPQTGRYLQADPLGLAGGMNPYLYAEGNPLTNYDPYGLQSVGEDGTNTGSIDPWPGEPPRFGKGWAAGWLGEVGYGPLEACRGGSGLGGLNWSCAWGYSLASKLKELSISMGSRGSLMPIPGRASPSRTSGSIQSQPGGPRAVGGSPAGQLCPRCAAELIPAYELNRWPIIVPARGRGVTPADRERAKAQAARHGYTGPVDVAHTEAHVFTVPGQIVLVRPQVSKKNQAEGPDIRRAAAARRSRNAADPAGTQLHARPPGCR